VTERLVATFIPRFAATAKTRLARSVELAARRTTEAATTIARELHTIAGEAGVLGLATVLPLVRTSETITKRFHATMSDADADALVASLEALDRAIDDLGAAPQTTARI
jgi:chemotaxis protein histidine kinase CheA